MLHKYNQPGVLSLPQTHLSHLKAFHPLFPLPWNALAPLLQLHGHLLPSVMSPLQKCLPWLTCLNGGSPYPFCYPLLQLFIFFIPSIISFFAYLLTYYFHLPQDFNLYKDLDHIYTVYHWNPSTQNITLPQGSPIKLLFILFIFLTGFKYILIFLIGI